MRGEIIIFLSILGAVLSAPSTEQGFVVSSTEPTKENDKEVVPALPLDPEIYEMDIHSNISNRFATTLVVSKVKNPNNVAKETTFSVVLPEKAFISEFVMEIGGKTYKAYVKEKEEAKKIYDQAVSSGISAAHVAVNARDSNRFTVSLNIEPEAKAVFLLTYLELLERKNSQYELVLNIHPGQIVKALNIEVHINETRPLKFVQTPSLRSGNEISKNDDKLNPSSDIEIVNSTNAVVKFQPDSKQQKEFALKLGTKESDGLSGQFVVQYDVERDPHGGEILLEDGYFVHFFAPQDLEPLSKHVVFVLDTSGSMSGKKLEQLKDAMNRILSQFRKGDTLNIVDFNYEANVWDVESGNTTEVIIRTYEDPFAKLRETSLAAPISANEDTIEKAKNAINKLVALGGTNIISGLVTALYLVKRNMEENIISNIRNQPIIIFLTDGDPNIGVSPTDEIIKIVTRLNTENSTVPIFSLSFGDGADKDFLRKLSLKNLGFSRHIYEAADASLQLQDFYKQISSPLLSNVVFKYNDAQIEAVTKINFPICFLGSELVVSGRYKDSLDNAFIEAHGSTGMIKVKPTILRPVTSLEKLWAYLTVKQTLDKRDTVENKTELTKKALDLALKYSFVTDVSSLVVVKPNDTSAVDPENAASRPNRYQASGLHYGARPPGLSANPVLACSPPDACRVTNYIYGPPPSYDAVQSPMPANPALACGPPFVCRPELHIPSSFGTGPDAVKNYLNSLTSPRPMPPIPTSTTSTPSIEDLLPWLVSALNANRTLSIQQGTYELGDKVHSNSTDTCPKTPLNDTNTGHCTLLKDCPELYSYLTDFQVYQQYFCPVDMAYAGVCCPEKKSTN